VVELALMAEAAAHVSGRDDPVHTIPFARLRHLVVPGDRLEISARTVSGGRVRVDLTRGDTVVANATLELGAPRPAASAAQRADGPAAGGAPARSAPAASPMRLVTAIAREVDGLVCTARVGGVLARRDSARARAIRSGGACGEWEGLRRWRSDGAAPGRATSSRSATSCSSRGVPADADLLASIGSPPRAAHPYAVEVERPQRILRGTIATFSLVTASQTRKTTCSGAPDRVLDLPRDPSHRRLEIRAPVGVAPPRSAGGTRASAAGLAEREPAAWHARRRASTAGPAGSGNGRPKASPPPSSARAVSLDRDDLPRSSLRPARPPAAVPV
jgi:hypothetical protein